MSVARAEPSRRAGSRASSIDTIGEEAVVTAKKNSICLNMIVKDESAVIERCLESVVRHIDYWVVCDTGSQDDTIERIESYFARHGIPGELHRHTWVDFGHNRTRALELARGRADYTLVMDADDIFMSGRDFTFEGLTADGYRLLHHADGGMHHFKERLVRGDRPWRWIGVLHEYLDCPGAEVENLMGNYALSARCEGARSRCEDKYLRDAAILEAALREEPNNERTVFYLAQSYRDAGDPKRALERYTQRVAMGGWAEEVYFAAFQAARMKAQLHFPWAEILGDFLRAWESRPHRLEALFEALVIMRRRNMWRAAYALARSVETTRSTDDILFVSTDVYRWRILDERAVAASWLGRWGEAAAINRELIVEPTIPEDERRRIAMNLRQCERELAASAIAA